MHCVNREESGLARYRFDSQTEQSQAGRCGWWRYLFISGHHHAAFAELDGRNGALHGPLMGLFMGDADTVSPGFQCLDCHAAALAAGERL